MFTDSTNVTKRYVKKHCGVLFTIISLGMPNAIMAADNTPFIMAYAPNYLGYNNSNTSTEEKSENNPCKNNGYYIAQAPYNVPGIQEEGTYVGFPACDKGENPDASEGHDGTTENQHFLDMLEGLSAVAYGFFLPQKNGFFIFSDPWSDQQLANYDTGGLCNSSTDGSEVCYLDDTDTASGLAGGTAGTSTYIVQDPDNENCWDMECYGSADAFTALQNSSNTLGHYAAIGGWTYKTYMDRLVAVEDDDEQSATYGQMMINDTNIENFEKAVANLVNHGFDGIDLDIEFNDASTDYTDSLLLQSLTDTGDGKGLIEQLKAYVLKVTGKTVAMSVTIQANPGLLQYLMGNGSSEVEHISSWFTQDLDHLNLMTYDNHGVFDYGSGSNNHTGFNSNLFTYDNEAYSDPFALYTDPVTGEDDDFSVDGAIQYLNAANGAESLSSWNTLTDGELAKVNIGLASYGRGMTGVTASDPSGTGLYQSIDNASAFPGDQDQTSCSLDLSSADACNGMFSYNYIVKDMLTSGFAATDWTYHDEISGKDLSIASTMFANDWSPVTSTLVFDTANNVTAVDFSSAYPESVSNAYVAYTSATVANSYGYYAKNRKLGGVIMWTINGDWSYPTSDDASNTEAKQNSLIYNFQQGYAEAVIDETSAASTSTTATE